MMSAVKAVNCRRKTSRCRVAEWRSHPDSCNMDSEHAPSGANTRKVSLSLKWASRHFKALFPYPPSEQLHGSSWCAGLTSWVCVTIWSTRMLGWREAMEVRPLAMMKRSSHPKCQLSGVQVELGAADVPSEKCVYTVHTCLYIFWMYNLYCWFLFILNK